MIYWVAILVHSIKKEIIISNFISQFFQNVFMGADGGTSINHFVVAVQNHTSSSFQKLIFGFPFRKVNLSFWGMIIFDKVDNCIFSLQSAIGSKHWIIN